jgi:hypothetical protein
MLIRVKKKWIWNEVFFIYFRLMGLCRERCEILQYERFFRPGETVVMSTYAPITFPPAPVLIFQVTLPACLSAPLSPACHYVCLPARPLACLPACLPARSPACLCLPVCPPDRLPACMYVCLSARPLACLPVCMYVCLYACMPACLPACQPARPYAWLPASCVPASLLDCLHNEYVSLSIGLPAYDTRNCLSVEA